MACFDHFPILISQMVLPAYEDHDMVDAESRSRCRRIRMLGRQTNSRNCAVWTGRAVLSSPILYLSSGINSRGERDGLYSWKRKYL
jgi:hypothetical protein